MDTAANAIQGEARVKELMERAGVSKAGELKKAKDIYENVFRFLENTGFAPPLRPPGKY